MDKKNNNYDDGFGYITHETSQYGFDNFDENGTNENKVKKPAKKTEENKPTDYGDNFNSQTGDNPDDYVYDDDYDISRSSKSAKSAKSSKKRKKKANSTAVIVLIVCALVCVIFAVIFALTQCTDGNSALKSTTSPTTTPTTAVVTTQQEITQYVETQPYVQETEAPVVTEAPTQAVVTEAPTQAPTEAPVVTEAPTQAEVPTDVVQDGEVNSDTNSEDSDF